MQSLPVQKPGAPVLREPMLLLPPAPSSSPPAPRLEVHVSPAQWSTDPPSVLECLRRAGGVDSHQLPSPGCPTRQRSLRGLGVGGLLNPFCTYGTMGHYPLGCLSPPRPQDTSRTQYRSVPPHPQHHQHSTAESAWVEGDSRSQFLLGRAGRWGTYRRIGRPHDSLVPHPLT